MESGGLHSDVRDGLLVDLETRSVGVPIERGADLEMEPNPRPRFTDLLLDHLFVTSTRDQQISLPSITDGAKLVTMSAR